MNINKSDDENVLRLPDFEIGRSLGAKARNYDSYKAELHWYQESTVGKILWKLKPQKDGGYFIDEY